MTTTYDHQFFRAREPTSLRSAEVIVPIIVELLKPHSVIDVGCGTGTWLAAFARAGVDDVTGVDGDYVSADLLLIPQKRFIPHDLRTPLRFARRFDLALALEVAEHLPLDCAEEFVASLASLAPQVLFSAAIPFQGGHSHVNERWQSYWAQMFSRHRYRAVDCVRGRVWTNPNVEWWYAQNMLLFVADEALANNAALAAMVTDPERLSRVHPLNYLTKADPRYMSLRWTLQRACQLTRARLRKRLWQDRTMEDISAELPAELERLVGVYPSIPALCPRDHRPR